MTNDPYSTPTTRVDRTALAHYTAGVRRARAASPEPELPLVHPCDACEGRFATPKGLSTHVAQHCPGRAS